MVCILTDAPIFWLVNVFAYIRHPYAVWRFRRIVGYFPNVARPLRYNEKMHWRKVVDHNPLFVTFCDKLATKALVSRLCPTLRIPKVLWVGNDITAIPAELLERSVVIKSSHGCRQNFFPKADAAGRDIPVDRINGWLGQAHGQENLEWAYRPVDRKLFAEELILPDHGDELVDLSVHAVDGMPLFIEVIVGNKTSNQRKGYFRTDGMRWPELEQRRKRKRKRKPLGLLPEDFRLPSLYVEALDHAKCLSTDVDYARFDFITASERLYAGEITVYPGSGTTRHSDFPVYNAVVSDHWDLSKSWFLRSRHEGLWRLYAGAMNRFLRGRVG